MEAKTSHLKNDKIVSFYNHVIGNCKVVKAKYFYQDTLSWYTDDDIKNHKPHVVVNREGVCKFFISVESVFYHKDKDKYMKAFKTKKGAVNYINKLLG